MRTAEDVIDRIKIAIGAAKDADLSKTLGIPKTTISGWKSRNAVPFELCVQVSDSTGMSLDWLLTGQGQPARGGPGPDAGPAGAPTMSREEQAVLTLYRALDEDARREIRTVAEEKKRLREVERQLKDVQADLASRKKQA